MASPFAGLEIDFTDPALQELIELLAANFEFREEIRDVVRRAGVGGGAVPYHLPAYLLWPEVLTVAHRQDRHEAVLREVKRRAGKLAARIDALLSDNPPLMLQPPAASSGAWKDEGLEAKTGTSGTLLDVDFLRRGLEMASAVCLLTMGRRADGREWLGSGFLVEPDLVLTNHHVLHADLGAGPAADWVQAAFHHETGKDSLLVPGRASSIRGDRRRDWGVVRLERAVPDVTPLRLVAPRPLRRGEPAFIIQHPGGGLKKIGLYRNELRHFDDDVVQYLTETRTGSSGSPVFNKHWEVIALHQKWIASEGGGAGAAASFDSMAGSSAPEREVRNQGIFIERVIEGLQGSPATT